MNIKNKLLLLMGIITFQIYTTDQKSRLNESIEETSYLNTSFLCQYSEVKCKMKKDGFMPVAFNSIDGHLIKGLYRESCDAQFNIIICAGFYPGKKEGMATFIDLLPHNCNILFIDARGHGESDGPFFRSILWYGTTEYNDILGALDFITNKNKKPNFLLGICIGAFHCAHAILELQKYPNYDSYNLQGLIFDSGFKSLTDLLWIPTKDVQEKTLPALWKKYIYTSETKKAIKDFWLYKISKTMFSYCIGYPITLLISPFFYWYNSQTTLINKMHTIKIPILFTHCSNDTYADFNSIEKLQKKCSCSMLYTFEDSQHGLNHILYPNQYKSLLLEFIAKNVHT